MTADKVYLSSQIKAMDECCGVGGETLMHRAALAILGRLRLAGRLGGRICVVCGKGSNGGDGYALACLLSERGEDVRTVAVEKPSSPLAVHYSQKYVSLGGRHTEKLDAISDADTVVDCIFGFSFSGSLTDKCEEAVRLINGSGAFVVSADLPSGIEADSDKAPDLCVMADITCTFTAYKLALVSFPAKKFCGRVYLEDIGISGDVIDKAVPFADLTGKGTLKALPPRAQDAHKGVFGTLAAVCGSADMSGAAALACLAALKSGVGLVRLYTDKQCAAAVRSKLFEAIVRDDAEGLDPVEIRASALLLGCGCGRRFDRVIKRLLTSCKIPTVLDADGINCIAGDIELYRSIAAPLVVTPHPAEMARLTGTTTEAVNGNRVKTALAFAREYGFVTVLKGAATVIAAPDGRLCINTTGNTGLSKGGSGDVLAGLTASLLAQGIPLYESACLGAYLHGAAADALAAEKGVYALLPSELPEAIGRIMHFG